MATVILVRHGRSTANAAGVLAGRTAGIELDAIGLDQAAHTAERLAVVALAGAVVSPLERCRETARMIVARQEGAVATSVDESITECDYGDWQGRPLRELATEPLWRVVQTQPSAAAFPGGESLSAMQSRAVGAIRRHDARFESEFGPGAVWLAVSHGDIIKSVLADALGMHLDLFQRISVSPASISIIRYGTERPNVIASNTASGDLSWLRQSPPPADAQVGGDTGARS